MFLHDIVIWKNAMQPKNCWSNVCTWEWVLFAFYVFDIEYKYLMSNNFFFAFLLLLIPHKDISIKTGKKYWNRVNSIWLFNWINSNNNNKLWTDAKIDKRMSSTKEWSINALFKRYTQHRCCCAITTTVIVNDVL